jgi:hypothetical protein
VKIPPQGSQSAPPAALPGSKSKEESLGMRDIDGYMAAGKRTTISIPVGQVGNDRQIEIVEEQWEAVELKVLLRSKHSNPISGEIEYRLTKLSRGEPSRSLFTVPSGYRLMESPVVK